MTQPENEVLFNNDFVAYSQAKLHISDLIFQRGFGIFDFFKVVNGKPIFLKEHIARFAHSANEMGLTLPFSEEILIKRIKTLLARNNMHFSGVKITLTGGYSKDAFSIADPNLLVVQQPFSVSKEAQESGIKLMSVNHQRQLPTVKTVDYLMAVRQLPEMKKQGAQDILYFNHESVTECPRANFFMVNKQGEILTPKNNILSGISRQKILGFSESGLFSIRQTDITMDEVYNAKEAFISSTTKNILPIVGIDGYVLGDGNPGPITRAFMKKFADLIEEVTQNS